MFDLTSNSFWLALKNDIWKAFTYPGVEIQLYLAVFALMLALLFSILIKRIVQRRRPSYLRHSWIMHELMPVIILPLLSVLFLIIAGWISLVIVPFKPRTMEGILKIAMVWLVARLLLLIAQRHFMAYFISSVMLALALLSVTNLLAATQASLNEITFETSSFRLSLLGAIKGTFTLIVLFWGAGVLSRTGENWLRRLNLSFNARELAIKFMRIALYFAAFVLTLNEMGVDLTALTVFGGALAVGLGFGLQKITSNFISGIILLFEKTIQAGDLIEVGGEKGRVQRMAIRHTLIETADGREILIPNEDLITSKVTNWTYTSTRGRVDISLTVTFDSDANTLCSLLTETAKAAPDILSDPAPACYLREFSPLGFQFLVVFWINDVKDASAIKSKVMLHIAQIFAQNGIKFARA